MATTNQIGGGTGAISGTVLDKFVGDDWVFPFNFADANGNAIDMSAATFTASIITDGPYTVHALTGLDGSIDTTGAASGSVIVTALAALTSTLTEDVESVDAPNDNALVYTTRLALVVASPTINTNAILPIRVIKR